MKKKTPKAPIYTQRVIQLIDEYRAEYSRNYEEVYSMIGATKNNHSNYKKGITAFTVPQIIKCAQQMNVSTDWICGLTDDRTIHREVPPIIKLKQAVKELEQLINKS
ncbi:MAG: hypothetical protein WCG90_08395 [Chitinophagia bacterium]